MIETGVAHGVTSRIVLQALAQNDLGHLWSIDLLFPIDHRLHGERGILVNDACRPRWSYLEGSSKQRPPPLIVELGPGELFIHDSLHTAENTVFEMEQAASAMSAGGVIFAWTISTRTWASRPLPSGIPIPDHHLSIRGPRWNVRHSRQRANA